MDLEFIEQVYEGIHRFNERLVVAENAKHAVRIPPRTKCLKCWFPENVCVLSGEGRHGRGCAAGRPARQPPLLALLWRQRGRRDPGRGGARRGQAPAW